MPTHNANATESNRILIVDDTKAIHDDYRKVLSPDNDVVAGLDEMEASLFGESQEGDRKHSYELVSAYQGQEALELVRQSREENRPFALAFVDMRMPPGWDGVETITHLWEADPHLHTVICTAYSDYSWDDILEQLGKEDRMLILKKPFEHIEVLQIANALVSRWNLARKADMKMEELEELVKARAGKVMEQKAQLQTQIEEIQRTRLQLVQAEKMASIGQLAAGVAHEINNPVSFISGNLGSLRAYANDLQRLIKQQRICIAAVEAQAPDCAQHIQQSKALEQELDLDFMMSDLDELLDEAIEGTTRVKQIVADLLEFSHINRPDLVHADINTLLQKTVKMAASELKYKAEIKYQLGESVRCWCNGGKVGQVFLNLLMNAAYAIEEWGQISIRTGVEGDYVWIEVEDTGCGISEDNLVKIFDPFHTTKDVGEGTGLGLHIVQSIIDCHDGKVSVRSQVGIGTMFRIELPVDGPAEKEEDVRPNADAA